MSKCYCCGSDSGHSVNCPLRAAHGRISELEAQLAAATKDIEGLKADLETERMKLVACGVGALANTPESSSHCRIGKDNPFWSASLGDVYDAIDREMALRAERDALMEGRDDLWKQRRDWIRDQTRLNREINAHKCARESLLVERDRLARAVGWAVLAMRYAMNELNYRIWQIEKGHEPTIYGEMIVARDRLFTTLAELDKILGRGEGVCPNCQEPNSKCIGDQSSTDPFKRCPPDAGEALGEGEG